MRYRCVHAHADGRRDYFAHDLDASVSPKYFLSLSGMAELTRPASVVAHHRRRGTVLTQTQEEMLLLGAFALCALCTLGVVPLVPNVLRNQLISALSLAGFVSYRAFRQNASQGDGFPNMFQGYNYGFGTPPNVLPPDVAASPRSESGYGASGGGLFGFGNRRPYHQDGWGGGGLDPSRPNQPQNPRVQRPPQRYGEPPAAPLRPAAGSGTGDAAASARTQGIEFSGWTCPQNGEPCVFEEYTFY